MHRFRTYPPPSCLMHPPIFWLLSIRCLAVVLGWMIVGGLAAGQIYGQEVGAEANEMVVVYADGRQQPVTLTAFDGVQVSVRSPGDAASQTLRVADLLRIGPAVPAESVPVRTPRSVWLVDGSRLAATRLNVEGDTCRMFNDWCQLTISLDRIVAIQWNGPLDAQGWQRLQQQVQAIDGADDAVLMVDEAVRRGRIEVGSWQAVAGQGRAGQASGLRLEVAERSLDVAVSQVRAVVPSPALRQRFAVAAGDVWVGIDDGSRLRLRRADDEGRWELACGQVVEWKSTDEMAARLRRLASGDPVSGLLAEQSPLRYRAVPVFGEPQPLRQWSVGGSNGIEVAATSRMVFRLDGQQRLRGKVLVQASGTGPVQAACRFTIQTVDAGGTVTTHWQSEPLPADGGKSVQAFDVSLGGGRLLILGSDSVSAGDSGQPLWLDAVLSEST